MNNYSKLIRSNVISLNEVLIQNYKNIGLDEIDMTILVLLNLQKLNQDNALSTNSLAEKMTLNENEISERILSLLQKGYLELIIDDVTSQEKFSLDPVIEKISAILSEEPKQETNQKMVQKVVEYCQKIYQRILSVEELKIVHMWVDDNYSYEEISEAVFDSLKAKKTQIKYADAILVNRRQNMNREKVDVDPYIKEVLNSINVNRNYYTIINNFRRIISKRKVWIKS